MKLDWFELSPWSIKYTKGKNLFFSGERNCCENFLIDPKRFAECYRHSGNSNAFSKTPKQSKSFQIFVKHIFSSLQLLIVQTSYWKKGSFTEAVIGKSLIPLPSNVKLPVAKTAAKFLPNVSRLKSFSFLVTSFFSCLFIWWLNVNF